MKLLSRYYRVNITATIIVVLVSSVCYYFLVHYVLLEQLDDALKVEEQEVIDHVKKNKSLPEASSYNDQQVIFFELAAPCKRELSTVHIYNKDEKEYITTRQLLFPIKVRDKFYKVHILKSQEETEDLVKLILLLTLIILVLLLAILFLVNRFFLRRLWKPFNTTIGELKKFNLSGKEKLQLSQSSINEFRELNDAVSIMASHVSREYDTLKEFTENASHEMQTPLAIINSKLDVLIQDDTISEFQMRQLQGIYDALGRLASLNQSLLLLTKIENNQFKEIENIKLDILVRDKLMQFDELGDGKKLNIHTDLGEACIQSNKQLIDILIGNLLSNAIVFNEQQGEITITLTPAFFKISNTSLIPALDPEKVFRRFYRHTGTKQEGNGLGLSIVKQICDMAGYKITYEFNDNRHVFMIRF